MASYNNQGYSKDEVKSLQSFLGITGSGVDGMAGKNTNAAVKAAGYSSLSEAMAAMNNANTPAPTPSTPSASSAGAGRGSGSGTGTGSVDYSNLIKDAMARGATSSEVKTLVDQRVDKAVNTPGLSQYAYDDVYTAAMGYVNNKKTDEMYDDMMGRIETTFAETTAQQQKANEASVKSAVDALNRQKDSTNQSYQDVYRQLYIDKMNAQKNMGQRLAAQGLTGGAAESSMLDLSTSYEDALRQGEQARLGTLSDIETAIADTRATGDIANAQIASDNAINSLNSYTAALQNYINRKDQLAVQEAAAKENARAYAYQTAMAMLQSGNMASDDLLEQAGISKTDALTIAQAAAAAATAKYRGSVGNQKTEYDPLIKGIAAASGGTYSEADVAAMMAAGYKFPEYQAIFPELKNFTWTGVDHNTGKTYTDSGYARTHTQVRQAYLGGVPSSEIELMISEAYNNGLINDLQFNQLLDAYG